MAATLRGQDPPCPQHPPMAGCTWALEEVKGRSRKPRKWGLVCRNCCAWHSERQTPRHLAHCRPSAAPTVSRYVDEQRAAAEAAARATVGGMVPKTPPEASKRSLAHSPPKVAKSKGPQLPPPLPFPPAAGAVCLAPAGSGPPAAKAAPADFVGVGAEKRLAALR